MSSNTPEEQKKRWLELALQNKRLLEEEGRRNAVVSALSSRVPVLIFSQPKRTEILMLKGKRKKKKILSQQFQNRLLDQFLEEQQKKIKEESEDESAKNRAALPKPKFLEMHLSLRSRNH